MPKEHYAAKQYLERRKRGELPNNPNPSHLSFDLPNPQSPPLHLEEFPAEKCWQDKLTRSQWLQRPPEPTLFENKNIDP
jgi:hypothetical protein